MDNFVVKSEFAGESDREVENNDQICTDNTFLVKGEVEDNVSLSVSKPRIFEQIVVKGEVNFINNASSALSQLRDQKENISERKGI